MYYMSRFRKAHSKMIADKDVETLVSRLSMFAQKSHADVTKDDLAELILTFQVIGNFSENEESQKELIRLNVIEKMDSVFRKYNEVYFLSDVYIQTLKKMAESYTGSMFLKSAQLDLTEICRFAFTTNNIVTIEATRSVVSRLKEEEDIAKLATEIIKGGSGAIDAIMVLSLAGDHNASSQRLSDSALIDAILKAFTDQKTAEVQRIVTVTALLTLVKAHKVQADHLQKAGGLDTVFQITMFNNSLFLWSQFAALVLAMSQQLTDSDPSGQLSHKYLALILGKLESFGPILDTFLRNAVTIERALNSISWHQGEVARHILKTLKNFKESDVVPIESALNFLIAQSFALNTLALAGNLKRKSEQAPFTPNDNIMNALLLYMKVFKTAERLYEQIFDSLSVCSYTVEQASSLSNSQWFSFLGDIVLKRPEWKRTHLNIMRFMGAILNNKANVKPIQSNVNALKLIAIIKNYIIEEDLNDSEAVDNAQEAAVNSTANAHQDTFSFAEEREVYQKGTQLFESLIDTSSLSTFRVNVERGVQNFKPKSEVVQILRADLAVLACVNSVNVFGSEGLKSGLHQTLKGYLTAIEKLTNGANFADREKLIGDFIRAIANFISITGTESGVKQYESAEVSVLVFELLERNLKDASSVLQAIVLLKVFKEWLLNRLEIIEEIESNRRTVAGTTDNFMLVPQQKYEPLMTNVMDSLYQIFARFYKNERVVTLYLEVIRLLSWISKDWKKRAGQTFIAQTLEVLTSDLYTLRTDAQAIELLKVLTSTDDRSEEPNERMIKALLTGNALEKVFKLISHSGFDAELITACQPLIEGMIIQDTEAESTATRKLIDDFMQKIDEFNSLPEAQKMDSAKLMSLQLALEHLNNFALADVLGEYLKEKQFPKRIGELWQFVDRNIGKQTDPKLNLSLEVLDKACAIGAVNLVSRPHAEGKALFPTTNNKDFKADSPDVFVNCLKSLYRNETVPEMTYYCTKILNSQFPGPQSEWITNAHESLKGQQVLESIRKRYESDKDKELAKEVADVYLNLTEEKSQGFLNKEVQKQFKDLDAAILDRDLPAASTLIKGLGPWISQPEMIRTLPESTIENRIVAILSLLQSSVQSKVGKSGSKMAEEGLSAATVPDLSVNDKQKLKDEIALSQNLVLFLDNLPKEALVGIQKNDEVIKGLELPLVLNGEISSLKLVDQLLAMGPSIPKLNAAGMFQTVTYILLRKNKDAFKNQVQIEAEDFGRSAVMAMRNSTISALSASALVTKNRPSVIQLTNPRDQAANIFTSTLPVDGETVAANKKMTQSRTEQIAENLALYTKVVTPLVTEDKLKDIIAGYLSAMQSLAPEQAQSIFSAVVASRQMISILHLKDKDFDFAPYAKQLTPAFADFYKKFRRSNCPSKKLLRLTEGILAKVAKRLNESKTPLRDVRLWNKAVTFYLGSRPDLIEGNSRKIFKFLCMVKPRIAHKHYIKLVFDSKVGKFKFMFDFNRINILSKGNQKNAGQILKNLKPILTKGKVTTPHLFNLLEGFSRSKTGSTELLQSELWEAVVLLLNTFEDYGDQATFDDMAVVLTNVCGITQDSDILKKEFNKKAHSDNYSKKFFDVIDGFHKHLFKRTIYTLVQLYVSVTNPSGFYDQKIPEKLLEIVGQTDDWQTGDLMYFLLFALMIENDSFESMFKQLGYSDMVTEYVEGRVLDMPPAVAKLSDLGDGKVEGSSDQNIVMAEVMCYSLGEFSKYLHFANKTGNRLANDPEIMFKAFKAFQACGADIIIAVKLIEFVRNRIYGFTDQMAEDNSAALKALITQISIEQQKHLNSPLIIKYLNEILSKLKEFEINRRQSAGLSNSQTGQQKAATDGQNEDVLRKLSKAERNALAPADIENAQKNSVNFSISDIAELLKRSAETLKNNKLSEIDSNLMGVCLERIGSLLSKGESGALYTLYSLDIPLHLRVVANSANAQNFFRKEALLILLGLATIPDLLQKMVATDFFVERSISNCKATAKLAATIDQLDNDYKDILEKDLSYLHYLTRVPSGAESAIALEQQDIGLLVFLLSIADSQSKLVTIKAGTLLVLNNIISQQRFEPVESHVIRRQKELFADNYTECKTMLPLLYTEAIVARGAKANKLAMINAGILDQLKGVIDVFQRDNLMNVAIANLMLELATDCPEIHQKMLSSPVMPFLAAAFNNALGEKRLYDFVAKLILQIGYQSSEKKLKLIDIGFAAGLITLFDLFSAGQLYDQDICLSILKCMANFSVMPIGAEHLLKDKVINSFKRYFGAYKDTMDEQIKLIMITMSNMAYMPKQLNLDMIVTDGGVQLMLECLTLAEETHREELSEACIDALTQISSDSKALQFLQVTNAIDVIVDVVRRQTNEQLIYKGLMCMNQLTRYDYFAKRIYEKGGHAVGAEIIKVHPKDPKNVLQSLKLLKSLVAVYPDRPKQFLQAGVPEKIVKVFSEDWP